MSSDSQYDERFDPEPPPKKGMSTGIKVLIILLCVFGGIGLLCCGGVVYIGFQFKNGFSEDPETVVSVTKKIAEIEIPATFSPVASVNFDFWFFPAKVRMVIYQAKDQGGVLTLMEMVIPGAADDKAQEQQFRQNMKQQGQGQNIRDLTIKKSVQKKFTIRGEEIAFTFAEAVDEASKEKFRQVRGVFPGKEKGSAVMLMLQLREKQYKEAEVVKMIKSIK